MTTQYLLRAISTLCLALAMLTIGCEDKRRHGANKGIAVEEVSPPVAADAPPADVAKALLAALGRAQEARSRGLGESERRQTYERAMAEIISLTAKKEVADQLRTGSKGHVAKDITDDAAMTLTVESWVSLVAHYVQGLMPETLRVMPSASPSIADVRITAESPQDQAVLASLQSTGSSTSQPGASTRPATTPPNTLDATARAEALRRGVNPLSRAEIQIRLKQIDGRWRATGMTLGPAGVTFLQQLPIQTMPTTSQRSDIKSSPSPS
jgi:hypothetical protein